MIPKDPMMLLCWLNTQLRDFCPCLEELCKTHGLNADELAETMETIDYAYDPETNQFI